MSIATISCVTLNQFALDFEGNLSRILQSVEICKKEGSRFRCGPELEVPGYSCQDHFYESDTLNHSWEVVGILLQKCQGILMDVGIPVSHNGVTYNCRVIFLNGKIVLIRPKMILCDDGNYRESRWFTGWSKTAVIEDYYLPLAIREITSQTKVPFGDALLQLQDTCIGFEICEELWNPQSTHIPQTLAGAEIIINASGSHTEIRKASYALQLIQSASSKCGCLYVFSNLRGCDGERLYMNGCSSIVLNGSVLKLGEQYSLEDVEVCTASFILDEIRTYKNSIRSRNLQASRSNSYPLIEVPWSLSLSEVQIRLEPTPPMKEGEVTFCCPEEEIARGPALWLWDYLRRSTASGFFLPLSGGVDSSSVAIIVYSMCWMITKYLENRNHGYQQVLKDVRRILKDPDYVPDSDPRQLCGKLLTTCYMGSENSSQDTRNKAQDLATAIGSRHTEINISNVCSQFVSEVANGLECNVPTFNGRREENMALQNVQARSRMVFAYMFAQLGPWSLGKGGFLLVLGTANVDEAIRGYFTKYDCSSADLNPIGGISKTDLKSFITYAGNKFGFPQVQEIVTAPPTAELKPLSDNQTDEEDMGMTYEELSFYGKLRKPMGCGPYSMFIRLLSLWKGRFSPEQIAEKVKHFYTSYASNRHKMTVLTPAIHMESYGPEDHRYDLRPILYPSVFTWQFRKIDEHLNKLKT